MSPVGFFLRMLLRIAINFRRAGEEEPRTLSLGQSERVVGAQRANLERLDRQFQVVDRARGRGEVHHAIHTTVDLNVLRDVVLDQVESTIGF